MSAADLPAGSVLPAGAIVDGLDCSGMVDDPKKDGIPVWLQTQNRRPLTPEQLAAVRAREAAARAREKVARAERRDMARRLGMSVVAMRVPGAKLKSETEEESVMAKKTKAKARTKRRATAVRVEKRTTDLRPDSKLAIVVSLLTRKEGCTTADVLAATGWPTVSMPQQAKAAGLVLSKEKDGAVFRYRGTPA